MRSKNKPAPTVAEAEYIRYVAKQPCSVCDQGGGEAAPSEVHEINQGCWWLSIALCGDCHRGSFNGLHGQRRMWHLKKLDELGALAITIRRVFECAGRLS
ncbi:hypothetical protein [Hydrogenophaga sp.]|uniref:hypothetical protein n=1 Tax=Hydrogenophaga sp. TaxID=1904254 RepID=UPI003D14E26F